MLRVSLHLKIRGCSNRDVQNLGKTTKQIVSGASIVNATIGALHTSIAMLNLLP